MSSVQLGAVVRQLHRLAGAPTPEVSDGQLLEHFSSSGEEAAFEALVRRHGPMVLGVCRRVLRDGHATEDAFQATFLVLLRRAGGLDRRCSLAGWLYTVAYHVALRARADAARRRRKEAAVLPPIPTEPQPDLAWRELQPVLDEELDRLPEHWRAPVVLCYLEGHTNEEAGRLLGWPVGTVKSRLSRARDLLRTRLTRRGVTLSAGLFSGTLTPAIAALPAALTHHTVQAALRTATAGSASHTAIALAEGALSTMSLVKHKMVAAFLLLASLTALGVSAFAGQAEAQRHTAPFTGEPPALAQPEAKTPAAPDKAAPKETVTLAGRVLGGNGMPLPGARVAVLGKPARPGPVPQVLGETRTDREGKFSLVVRRQAEGGHELVLASAPGHGPAWQYPLPKDGKPLELKLPAELVLRGRLIELQGQPAARVKLQVIRLGPRGAPDGHVVYRRATDSDENEMAWAVWHSRRALRYMASSLSDGAKQPPPKEPPPPPIPTVVIQDPPAQLPGWPATVTTDAQGRFVLRGVGKGQGLGLLVADERFGLQVLDFPARERDDEVTQVLAPARVLEGTVTDADSGQPVAGARLRVVSPRSSRTVSAEFAEGLGGTDARGRRGMLVNRLRMEFVTFYRYLDTQEELPPLEARTDAQGRYRFHLFPANSYGLKVIGPDGKHYLPRTAGVSWPGEAIVRKRLDLTLQRGAILRGRVTEAGGEPVAKARVDFWCKGLKWPEGTRAQEHLTTGKDGTFQALLPPGPWRLLVNGPEPLYRIQKIAIGELTGEQITAEPQFSPDAWVAVDLKPGTEREVTVSLRRAPLLRGLVVGPDGKPVSGVYLVRRPVVPSERIVYPENSGRFASYAIDRPKGKVTPEGKVISLYVDLLLERQWPREEVRPVELRDGTFSIAVLDPEATYRLHLLAPSGQVGAVVELSGKQAGGEPVTVRLQPCGQATARLVDGQRKPLAGHRPLVWLLLPPGPHAVPADLTTLLPHDLRTHNVVWAAYLDPARHGDGPRSDAEGRVTLPALIPGATYRVFLGPGKARDFRVEAGRLAELGDLTIDSPALTEKLPTVRPGK
ncbi:MAG TPA: sigma-70 family RNA polymerase sigma factor [Gemmataceae bacterium]|nr:sigma-70 family RNA polymerase sigma factor [Gemmataceae bacterium]